MIKRILFFTALLCLSAVKTYVNAQAFNTFNNRNHPEIEWMESETEHFRIMYGKHLAGIEIQAAAIAEETYAVLSKSLNCTFDRKIKIYLSDEDEITNGAATFINQSYTFIWVEINEAPDFFSGDRKWLRKVLSHELAHLFQFEATKSNMGIWGFVFGDSGDRSFTEGYAQYASEFWDAQRGDRWLRSAIFDDKPSFNDGSSPLAGRLIYAKGFSQLLFINNQYGDSTISNMFAYRDTLLFGFTYPDIYKGFEKTTKEKWSDFDNRWLKHVNIYYNTLASQMDRTDSLKGKKVEVNGLMKLDFKASPSGKKAVASSFVSMELPVFKTELFERDSLGFKMKRGLFVGRINSDLAWSADETKLFYSKNDRAKNSSLVNDVYEFDLKSNQEKRLSYNARLAFPVQGNKKSLFAIQNVKGTGNVVQLDIKTGEISPFTSFLGDIQILYLTINPSKTHLAFTKIDEKGNRTIEILDCKTKEIKSFTQGETDDKKPVFSPDGKKIAFTSLRDKVANVFVLDLESSEIERGTYVFTGAELLDWFPTENEGKGKWVLKSSESKSQDQFFEVADSIRSTKSEPKVPQIYSAWTTSSPSAQIPGFVETNPNLVLPTKEYSHFKNIGHILSLGFPYSDNSGSSNDYGIVGFSAWGDPLGKHNFITSGSLSFVDIKNSYGIAQYLNSTQIFSWSFEAYRMPGALQFYSDRFLVSTMSGFSAGISRDLDWKPKNYSNSRYMLTTRAFLWEASSSSIYKNTPNFGFADAWQNDIIAAFELKHLIPYAHNDIHPLSGFGLNVSMKLGLNASNSWFGENQKQFALFDFRWFDVRPLIGEITWFNSFRAQAQFGNPLPFEAVQLSRYDNFTLPQIVQLPLSVWNAPDRVRGFRNFILSEQLYFSSSEIRLPFLPSLATQVLGLVSFDKTTVALFSDVAFANNITFGNPENQLWQWGLGAEIKNKITFLGILPIVHSFGYAQPYDKLFAKSPYDLYYRIQASIPF